MAALLLLSFEQDCLTFLLLNVVPHFCSFKLGSDEALADAHLLDFILQICDSFFQSSALILHGLVGDRLLDLLIDRANLRLYFVHLLQMSFIRCSK